MEGLPLFTAMARPRAGDVASHKGEAARAEMAAGPGAARRWHRLAMIALVLPLAGLGIGAWLAWEWAEGEAAGSAWAAWWHLMALPAAIAIGTTTALIMQIRATARLARHADAAGAALEAETRRRHAVEQALHHAQKLESVGRLAGGIAHDFNNHLTVISSNVELMQRRLPEGATALKRLSDSALLGVRQAAALTQRLLAFSRQQTLDPEPLDAGKLVAGMLDLLRRTLGEKIDVDTIAMPGLWLTRTDANQLESALLNLAVNAHDAMPGGGRLTIETANMALDDPTLDDPAADASDLPPGHYVMVAVHDTGTGMAADVRARALEPFFTTKPAGEGSGLGLPAVLGFVRQSGGHLRIDSTPGHGTTVRLYLPRHVVPTAPAEIAPSVHAPSETPTVLVVEDEDTVRNAAAEALREIGYEVLEAPDAMEAVRLLADRGGIDLLFTDVGLPGGVNGRALADAARNIHPELKILFTTGYQGEAILRAGLSKGKEYFLPKPFSLEQLEAKVRAVLDAPVADSPAIAPTVSAV